MEDCLCKRIVKNIIGEKKDKDGRLVTKEMEHIEKKYDEKDD